MKLNRLFSKNTKKVRIKYASTVKSIPLVFRLFLKCKMKRENCTVFMKDTNESKVLKKLPTYCREYQLYSIKGIKTYSSQNR